MPDMSHRLTASLVLAGAFGCAALAPPLTSPAHGGARWTLIESPHFELKTDLAPDDGREALAELERMYTVLMDVAFPFDDRHRPISPP
jgi:hypothetical protein